MAAAYIHISNELDICCRDGAFTNLELKSVFVVARIQGEGLLDIREQLILLHARWPHHLRFVQELVDFQYGSLFVRATRFDRRHEPRPRLPL